MIRIAIDAMGGDKAPEAIVTGAVEAARKAENQYEIVLVGNSDRITDEIHRHYFTKDLSISVVHAPETIGMDESPAMALRRKPESSIAIAARLHQEGKVDAVVSAGNTGAMVAASLLYLKRIKGVKRPAVGAFMPHSDGVCFIIDVGTSVDSRPIQLLQFGIMGSIFVSHILEIASPRVGLLNIGEESGKGSKAVQEAYRMLEASSLNFTGNLEGRDVLSGRADVVVCDGFAGNVLLKFLESMGKMLSMTMRRTIRGNLPGAVGLYLIRPSLRKFYKLFDYEEYGGAPLLGIKGNCIIGHGSSGPRAIKNAVEEAWKMIQRKVAFHIESQIVQMEGD